MALIITRAVGSAHIHARQVLLNQACRLLPGATQVAHLTSTGGVPKLRDYPAFPYKTRRYNEFWQFFDSTRKRFDDNTKVILIEGNLAVGKSSFGEMLAKEFDMKFFPDSRDSKVFLAGEDFDKRSLNEQLPPRARFCDIATFYDHKVHPATLKSFGRTQLIMYMQRFIEYANALEHLLNTGQGVVIERGIYSDMVFQYVLRKLGHLTGEGYKYLNFVYENTICEMWRPHLVIYLDAPVNYVREQILKRHTLWEVNSPIITDEFLTLIDKTYKEKYLPYMSTWSEILTLDLMEFPDWEIIVEDLEAIDLDTQPYGNEDKFKDWMSEFEDDFNLMRMNVAKKGQLEALFSMRLPYEAPELMVHHDDYDVYRKVVEEHPEVKYRPGYNPETKNVLLKW